jgi:class 3 adenylate cyclase
MTEPTAAPDGDDTAVIAALDRAERTGFRLMLFGRSAVLALMMLWTLYGTWITGNPAGPIASGLALAIGLFALYPLGKPIERRWHRYAVVALDAAAMAAIATFVPLLENADVPQVMVYRAYGTQYLWFLPVVSALALSPGLTLFAGAASAAAVWAVFVGVTVDMPQMLSWSNLPADATAAEYVGLLLDPSFVGRGNRVGESVALLVGGAVLALAVSRARRVVGAHSAEQARRRRVEHLFGRYVPETVVDRLIATPTDFAPTVQDATALYLDAAGFTAFSDGKPPADVMATLDGLISRASAAVARHGGVVVSFGGDSVLATFGAPVELADHADQALAAARAILEEMQDGPLRVRIGLASGPIAAGIVGSDARQAFSVYGETVNLAQRLEQANKQVGGWLLVGDSTYRRLARADGLAVVPALDLPGVAERIVAYADGSVATTSS